MKEMLIPECMKTVIEKFYDNLCRVLTDWEQGEIDDFELYGFMVEVANDITGIAYDD